MRRSGVAVRRPGTGCTRDVISGVGEEASPERGLPTWRGPLMKAIFRLASARHGRVGEAAGLVGHCDQFSCD
jgi:hypothetical protein